MVLRGYRRELPKPEPDASSSPFEAEVEA
jgi:hypothetical protein